MSAPSLRPQYGLRLVLLAAFLSTLLKCAWALSSRGTSDALLFFIYGQSFSHASLAEMYASGPMFNHTPLTAYLMRGLYGLTQGNFFNFSAALRLVSIAADLGVVALLLYLKRLTGRPPWWALVLFAASPVSLMVSGFHGNVDPLLVLFLAAAAVAAVAGEAALCGALFALSANVKIVPLLLAPIFFFYWLRQGRRSLLHFAGASALVMLLGAALPLLECPALYLRNVYGYGAYFGTWGITYWLHQLGGPEFQEIGFMGLSPAQSLVAQILKWSMIAGLLALAWRRRETQGAALFTSIAAAFAIVFVLAPGMGPQYLVWFAPFLLWSSPRWYAALTACCTAYMGSFYHPSAKFTFPWDYAVPTGPEIAYWGPWMNVPWVAFITLLAWHARAWWLLQPTPVTEPMPGGIPAAA